MEDPRRRMIPLVSTSALCGALVVPVVALADDAPSIDQFMDASASAGDDVAQPICEYAEAPLVPRHAAPVDCSESQDTGYKQGNPFAITVVHIDNKPVEKDTANAYWVMRQAAAADGVDMHIVSGFRTYAEQQYLYNCYINCNCNNCNLAAKPGFSNHQSGHALDLNASSPGVYSWLDNHGAAYGFTETVPGENWHWEWWGGGPGGGICDITSKPDGVVDQADCGIVRGWAQDPDHPDDPIAVHVYFGGPAGDPDAVAVEVLADRYREDLCEPLGSCDHAFELTFPLSLMDGASHPVHVYAIDLDGDGNPKIGLDEGLVCPAPPLPAGVRRHVPTPAAVEAWSFDLFNDRYVVDDAALLSLPEWVAIAPAPTLITTDEEPGPGVWLRDAGVRRHVPSSKAAAAWGFDLGAVEVLDVAEFYAIPEGTALRPAPRLVEGTGPALYLIDDPQMSPANPGDGTGGGTSATGGEPGSDSDTGPDPATSTGEPDDTADGGSAGGGDGDDDDEGTVGSDGADLGGGDADEGCSCRASSGGAGWLFGPALLVALGWRRRRRAAVLIAPGVLVVTASGCAGDGLEEGRVTDTSVVSASTDGGGSSDDASAGSGDGASAGASAGSGSSAGASTDAVDCDDAPQWYVDIDGDGFGRDAVMVSACEAPAGYVGIAGDCDDTNVHVNPGALEDCNERDDDCDGLLDEASTINGVCGACWLFDGAGEHVYWMCEAPVAWEQAQARCQALGAELASVQSQEENDLLLTYADKGVSVFLGLNDREVEGEHVWSDGSPVEFTRWNEGEPNDSQEAEDCVELKSGTGVWNDISCDAQRYFACEADQVRRDMLF
ncbi:MAG: D-alanyl-D-alanine carboxypeptidase family protein [Myxococcales bacterium]|nr:D-alanyl-D-alanine carboxypeptidase family protein [Myxococcales bacterium]MCB9753598.1 D-alanyl-D-alanine carboxypeptidase family protein [Myxococcales bacterium]